MTFLRVLPRNYSATWLLAGFAVLLVACNRAGPEPVDTGRDHTIEKQAVVIAAEKQAVIETAPVRPNSATLEWDGIPLPRIRGYRVYYGPDADMYLQLPGKGIEVGRVTSYTITGLVSGQRYYFAVTAVDGSGNESELSNQVFKDIP